MAEADQKDVKAEFSSEEVPVSSETSFDAFGRAKKVAGGTGDEQTTTEVSFYDDKAGRKDAGLLKEVRVGETGRQIVETYERDDRGNVTDVKRPGEHAGSHTEFDEWDRPWELTLGKALDGSVDDVSAKVTVEYDQAGHVASVRRKQKGLTGDVVVKYNYGPRGGAKSGALRSAHVERPRCALRLHHPHSSAPSGSFHQKRSMLA